MEYPAYDLYDLSIPPPAVLPGAMPFAAFVEEMLATAYTPSLCAPATRRAMVHAAGVLTGLNVTTTADLDIRLIGRVVASCPQTNTRATLRGLLRCVSALCTYAQETGRIPVSPFLVRKLRKWVKPSSPTGTLHLSAVEVRSLLDVLALDVAQREGFALWCARRLQALVATILYTGLRLGEATWLEVGDVDLVNGVIEIVDREAHSLKTERSAQPVIIPTALAPILASWMAHRDDAPKSMVRPPSPYVIRNWEAVTPWTYGSVGTKPLDRLKAVAKRAGIEYVSFLMLRRTVATMMELTCTDAMIMRQLRQSSPQTSRKHYRKADLDNMHAAMDGFNY